MRLKLLRVLTILIALTIHSFTNASIPDNLSLKKVILRTGDAEQLSKWYVENLQFSVESNDENRVILTKLGFELELVKHSNAIQLDSVKFKEGKNRVTGIYKYGFAINNLDSLFEYVNSKKLKTHGGIINDAQAGMRSFILIDPDDNYIQFFEKKGALLKLKDKPDWYPAFLMIYTNDFMSTYEWYAKLDFKEVSKYDNAERLIFQRSVFNNEILIELVEYLARVANKTDYPEIAQRLIGITAVGCASSIVHDSIIDATGNHIEIINRN